MNTYHGVLTRFRKNVTRKVEKGAARALKGALQSAGGIHQLST
jgi:hypothetical protein